MNLIGNAEFVFDVFKLAFYIACAYWALYVYARHLQTGWPRRFTDRRFAILTLLTLLIVGIKIFEDVIAKESGPVDTALLWFVREKTPTHWLGFFTMVTLSGSGKFLAPATAALASLFFVTQHRREATLLMLCMLSTWALTYTLKALVDRARPDLWSTAWYWGASFPSGHTLSTAAFATALSLCAARLWPWSRYAAATLAAVWIFLVGLSRLVLGVHWPTDVLAAICLGVFIPLAISLALDMHQYPRVRN